MMADETRSSLSRRLHRSPLRRSHRRQESELDQLLQSELGSPVRDYHKGALAKPGSAQLVGQQFLDRLRHRAGRFYWLAQRFVAGWLWLATNPPYPVQSL